MNRLNRFVCCSTSLLALASLAHTAVAQGESLSIHRTSGDVLEPNTKTPGTLELKNNGGKPIDIKVDWTLRLNSNGDDTTAPDGTLGINHATAATSYITIDGKDFGDALLTDGSEFTAFEPPWTSGYTEGIVDIKLDQARKITAIQWIAGDANWIWKADISSSLDGNKYEPIADLQGFEFHKKWGRNSLSISKPINAKFLRMRLYRDGGEKMNVLRLPSTIEIFDGVENDTFDVPNTGEVFAGGAFTTTVTPYNTMLVDFMSGTKIPPGAYLLSWKETVSGKSNTQWAHLFVRPSDAVNKDQARRFGINASTMALTDLMSDCGFGWVRFENGKWIMSSTAQDSYAFDGSVAPWHVNQDAIYENYHKHNMKVLPYVFQTPEWANSAGPEIKVNRAGYPPRKASDYGDAIYQFVARFGNKAVDPATLKTNDKKTGTKKIDAIELWNEPNLVGPEWAGFVGPIEQYFEVMREGVRGARQADPSMIVTSCGWAGTEMATLQQMTDYKYEDGTCPLDLVDVINVHFYSGRQEPETSLEDPNTRKKGSSGPDKTYLVQLDDLMQWRDKHKPSAEIWLTETGNDVGGPIGLSERKQAAKLPRVMMITLARGIEKAFIYRESGSDPSMHAGAGLVRNDHSLRPAWFTMATMMRQIQGFDGKATRLPHPDPNVWLLHWKNDQKSIVAAWTLGPNAQVATAQVLKDQKPKAIIDAFGHASAGTDQIELSEFPRYLQY